MKKFIYYSLLTVTVIVVLGIVAAAIYIPFNPIYTETHFLTSAPYSALIGLRLLLVVPVCLLSGLIMRYLGYDDQKERPPSSRITSKYLLRAALAAFLIALVLVNI